MLPVSGAEQLNGSAPMADRPISSHSGAYSRLVSPAPYSLSGRKRFHNPCAFAFAFSDSMIGTGSHRSPSATCRAAIASAGKTCSSMKRLTCAWISRARLPVSKIIPGAPSNGVGVTVAAFCAVS